MARKQIDSISYPDDRVIFSEDNIRYPMAEVDDYMVKEKLRGDKLIVTITIDNSQQEVDDKNIQVSITNFDTKFRISPPVQY